MKITSALLEKYAEGACTSDEIAAIEAWMNTTEGEVAFPEGENLKAVENRMWVYVTQSAQPEQKEGKVVRFDQYVKFGLRIAAVLVCVFSIGILAYKFVPNQPQIASVSTLVYKTIQTSKGEKIAVTLTDGTVITLNADSELRYPEKFNFSSRTVYLKGEAYFKVAKDSTKPFLVHTAGTITRVLGTAFNIEAYPEQKNVTLVVEEGKVRFSDSSVSDKHLFLTANTRGRYNGASMHIDTVFASKYFAWKDNVLVFDNVPMTEVARKLERFYNIRVEIKNTRIAEARYTGKFKNMSASSVIEGISFSMKFKYIYMNNILIVKNE